MYLEKVWLLPLKFYLLEKGLFPTMIITHIRAKILKQEKGRKGNWTGSTEEGVVYEQIGRLLKRTSCIPIPAANLVLWSLLIYFNNRVLQKCAPTCSNL